MKASVIIKTKSRVLGTSLKPHPKGIKSPSLMLNGKGNFKVTSWQYQWAFALCSRRAALGGLFNHQSLSTHFQASAVETHPFWTLPRLLCRTLHPLSHWGFLFGRMALVMASFSLSRHGLHVTFQMCNQRWFGLKTACSMWLAGEEFDRRKSHSLGPFNNFFPCKIGVDRGIYLPQEISDIEME